jgi:DNA-binding transcriptional LysR family regulator
MAEKKCTDRLDWEDIQFFLALARHGSLSAAARALRVNHATVSRRVACLEERLGKVLFDRRAGGYALTGDGQAILEESQPMEDAALSLLRRMDRGSSPGGPVRLTTTRVFADAFLVGRLGGFHLRYPAIELEVVTDSRPLSIARREADMALRFGPPKDSALLAQRLASIGFGFFAASEWRDRLAEGEAVRLIGFDNDGANAPEASWLEREFPQAQRSFRSNSWTSQANAARAGFGVALLPCYLAPPEEGLYPVSLGKLPPARDLWLLLRPDLAETPRIRATADFLTSLCRRDRALLAGGPSPWPSPSPSLPQ